MGCGNEAALKDPSLRRREMRMRRVLFWVLSALASVNVLSPLPVWAASQKEAQSASGPRIFISGRILDSHNEPVQDASVRIRIDGQPQEILSRGKKAEAIQSGSGGAYLVELEVPAGFGPSSKLDLEVRKASFRTTRIPFTGADLAQKGEHHHFSKDISVPRIAGPAFWIATVVFLAAYLLISFELLHRTIAAMLGAAVMLAISYTIGTLDPEYHIISFETAMHKIDMNVIFLLMGMMIIVGILKHTGVFQWCAYKCFQLARGSVFLLAVMFCTFTAVTSAFLDNVTTMLLLTPVTIAISQTLRLNPLTLLVPEVMASNVGGTSTLIGDPPNIMIGSYAGLTFMEFVRNLTVPCLVGLVALFFLIRLYYNRAYKEAQVAEVEAFTERLREEYKITDGTLLGYGLFILGFTIFLFITHGFWHMEVSIAALLGASVLFTYSILTKKVKMLELLEKDIEWPSLLFFMFLFMVVGAVEETGLLALIADWILELSKGNLTVAIVLILWVSAFLSAFVDNIPYTATMLPITAYLTQTIPGAESHVLWWALALGACLGGNGTIIGASANVVTMGIAESVGYPISFVRFMKFGFVYMIVSVAIANVWLLLFY